MDELMPQALNRFVCLLRKRQVRLGLGRQVTCLGYRDAEGPWQRRLAIMASSEFFFHIYILPANVERIFGRLGNR